MQLSDLTGLLQQYRNATPSNPPASVEEDFNNVAQNAPQEHIASGLAEAFRSNQTPPFPQMVASMFGQSNGEQRAGLLSQLMGSVGPSVATSGLLGGLSGLLGSGRTQVTPEQAQQVSPEAVQQLAEHAQQQNPSVVDQVSGFYSQHPRLVQGLGAGALALIMSHISQRQ